MKVAMVGLRAPWGTEGGVEHAVAELAPRLVRLGVEVTVYCRSRYNALGETEHQGVRLVNVDTVYSKHLEAMVHTGRAVPRALGGAGLVHIHATGPALWSWMPRLAGKAAVVTVHGLDFQRAKWGTAATLVLRAGARAAATFPDELITVGKHLQVHYQDHYGRKSHFIPNGVGEIPPVELAASGVDDLQPDGYFVYVGRLVPEKGLDRLVAAYGKARVQVPLVIVGGATHSEAWAAGLQKRAPAGVRFVGPRHGPARDALLTHARAFILPSDLEGFPLAPLEAMAAGLPVLLSDIPPHHEVLAGVEDTAGWLVARDQWSARLRKVAAMDSALLRAMGQVGRAHVQRHFSWDRAAVRTLQVYEQALGASPGL